MEQIYKILEEIRPEFDFKESNDYIEDGLLDSFDIVTVVSEIEAAFIGNSRQVPFSSSNVK